MGPQAAAPGFPGGAGGRGHPLLVFASMVVLACLSVVLPVVGAATAMAVIVTLRGGELAHSSSVRRRSRGPRASDAFVSVLAMPWFLVRSVLACVVLVPFAAAAGVVAGGLGFAAAGQSLPRAIAYGIGATVAFYGLGPGSSRSRRQLGRLFGAASGTRLAQAVALAGILVLAVAALAAAATWPPLYWPTHPPGTLIHIGVAPTGPLHHVGPVARYLLAHLRG